MSVDVVPAFALLLEQVLAFFLRRAGLSNGQAYAAARLEPDELAQLASLTDTMGVSERLASRGDSLTWLTGMLGLAQLVNAKMAAARAASAPRAAPRDADDATDAELVDDDAGDEQAEIVVVKEAADGAPTEVTINGRRFKYRGPAT